MPTKIIYIGTKPASSTGADVESTGPLSPANVDQIHANLQAAVDSKAPTASPVFTGTARVTNGTFGTSISGTANVINFGYGQDADTLSYINLGGYQDGSSRFRTLCVMNGKGGEVARFDGPSGNLLVGVASGTSHTIKKNAPSDYALAIDNSSGSNAYGLTVRLSGVASGAGNYFISCTDTAGKFLVTGNGNVQNVNNSYGAISDIKLKENIAPARDYLADLCRVNVVKYSLKADALAEANLLGVIAQELEEIFPGMVETTNDTAERQKVVGGVPQVDDDGNPVMERYETGETTKGVKYSVFVPMLIKAVQELSARLAALEAT